MKKDAILKLEAAILKMTKHLMVNDNYFYSSYVQGTFMQNVVLVSPSEILSPLSATLY